MSRRRSSYTRRIFADDALNDYYQRYASITEWYKGREDASDANLRMHGSLPRVVSISSSLRERWNAYLIDEQMSDDTEQWATHFPKELAARGLAAFLVPVPKRIGRGWIFV